MSPHAPERDTDSGAFERASPPASAMPLSIADLVSGRLLLVFAPILVLVAITLALALWAWVYGWRRVELLVAAAAAGILLILLAVVLLYRQARQRQAAQRFLKNVQTRATDLVEAAMDPIITVDEQQRILVFNAAAEKAFAWPRDAVIGQPLDKLIPERYRHQHKSHIERFATTGVTSRRMGGQTVLTGLRANGEEFFIEASISQHKEDGKRLLTVILRDISERVRDALRLAQSEASLRGVFDSAMDAIITVDDNQHIVFFNAAAEAMFGCSQGDAVGAPLTWFIPARFRESHRNHVRHFGEGPTASRRMGAQRIVTGLRRTGEEFPIEASISQLSGQDGKLFTVILRDVTERVRAEEAIRRSKEELRELGNAAHEAREQEKSRVSRELHDELGQELTALQMDVAWFKQRLPEADPILIAKLDKMEALLNRTVTATRRIAADLRPLVLDDLGLMPAIEWLLEGFMQRTGIECKLKISGEEFHGSDAQASAVFRIVQESLNNVAKHARASRVEIAIGQGDAQISVSVLDDGVGFVLDEARKPTSFGLVGLRERASMLGGRANIITTPGKGTQVEVSFPVAEGD